MAYPGNIALLSRCTRNLPLHHQALGLTRINLHDNQPWAVVHYSPLAGHPIPTLFADPVTIWPSPKVACPFCSSVYPRPGLAHVHVASALTSTAPGTQKLIHYLGRQGKYVWEIVSNSHETVDNCLRPLRTVWDFRELSKTSENCLNLPRTVWEFRELSKTSKNCLRVPRTV